MAKLSEGMAKILRAVRDGEPGTVAAWDVKGPSLVALRRRFAVKQDGESLSLTPTGRTLLDEHERTERTGREQAERASRPVPATAFVEPSAATPLVWGGEYDEDEDGPEEATTGPSVRLTPAQGNAEREATDAELLQLLTVLDHGGEVSRALCQDFGVLDAGPFRLDLEAVNRAAREAVRVGLAQQSFHGRRYWLTAEPVHLDLGNGMTGCGIAQTCSTLRRRWTTDPAKVTHDLCRLL